jgi:hypothetical protein
MEENTGLLAQIIRGALETSANPRVKRALERIKQTSDKGLCHIEININEEDVNIFRYGHWVTAQRTIKCGWGYEWNEVINNFHTNTYSVGEFITDKLSLDLYNRFHKKSFNSSPLITYLLDNGFQIEFIGLNFWSDYARMKIYW